MNKSILLSEKQFLIKSEVAMIIIPRFSKPKSFVKSVRTEAEVISADFKINTVVKFEQHMTSYYETKTIHNGSIIRIHNERIEPEKRYGFQLKIIISGKEYEKNKKNIRRYVVDKIKQTDDYKRFLMECIRKGDADREYTIDTYIADECNNPNLHYNINKIEEYIPQY